MFKKGKCTNGEECRHAHGVTELRRRRGGIPQDKTDQSSTNHQIEPSVSDSSFPSDERVSLLSSCHPITATSTRDCEDDQFLHIDTSDCTELQTNEREATISSPKEINEETENIQIENKKSSLEECVKMSEGGQERSQGFSLRSPSSTCDLKVSIDNDSNNVCKQHNKNCSNSNKNLDIDSKNLTNTKNKMKNQNSNNIIETTVNSMKKNHNDKKPNRNDNKTTNLKKTLNEPSFLVSSSPGDFLTKDELLSTTQLQVLSSNDRELQLPHSSSLSSLLSTQEPLPGAASVASLLPSLPSSHSDPILGLPHAVSAASVDLATNFYPGSFTRSTVASHCFSLSCGMCELLMSSEEEIAEYVPSDLISLLLGGMRSQSPGGSKLPVCLSCFVKLSVSLDSPPQAPTAIGYANSTSACESPSTSPMPFSVNNMNSNALSLSSLPLQNNINNNNNNNMNNNHLYSDYARRNEGLSHRDGPLAASVHQHPMMTAQQQQQQQHYYNFPHGYHNGYKSDSSSQTYKGMHSMTDSAIPHHHFHNEANHCHNQHQHHQIQQPSFQQSLDGNFAFTFQQHQDLGTLQHHPKQEILMPPFTSFVPHTVTNHHSPQHQNVFNYHAENHQLQYASSQQHMMYMQNSQPFQSYSHQHHF